jgi:hypothetical protein
MAMCLLNIIADRVPVTSKDSATDGRCCILIDDWKERELKAASYALVARGL